MVCEFDASNFSRDGSQKFRPPFFASASAEPAQGLRVSSGGNQREKSGARQMFLILAFLPLSLEVSSLSVLVAIVLTGTPSPASLQLEDEALEEDEHDDGRDSVEASAPWASCGCRMSSTCFIFWSFALNNILQIFQVLHLVVPASNCILSLL